MILSAIKDSARFSSRSAVSYSIFILAIGSPSCKFFADIVIIDSPAAIDLPSAIAALLNVSVPFPVATMVTSSP